MIQEFYPARRTRPCAPADAHGLALLLLAILLAAGTALPQVGTGGPAFPPPAGLQMVDRSVPAAVPRRLPTPLSLDINAASAEALQSLPGIGPALAARIVADREARGPFRTPEDLLRVPGIGPKRWEQMRPLVHLAGEP